MSFIDWSDPDEMLGLLSEYVVDERNNTTEDPAREAFLAELSTGLTRLADRRDSMSSDDLIEEMRAIHGSHAEEFRGDPVLVHVEACIEELERIRAELHLK